LGSKKQKIFLLLSSIIVLLFFGKDQHYENHINFACLIKGTSLKQAL